MTTTVNRRTVTSVQFAIMGGMALLVFTDAVRSFFGVFVVLKLLSDIGNMVPEINPKEPPRWLARIADTFPNQKGETLDAYWRRTRAEEADASERDERRS